MGILLEKREDTSEWKNSKGTYRDCRKSTANKLGYWYTYLYVLHEERMCLVMQRHTVQQFDLYIHLLYTS